MTNNRSFVIIVITVEYYCKLFQDVVFLSARIPRKNINKKALCTFDPQLISK